MSKKKIGLGVAAVLFAAYVVAAPFITVYQLRNAVESKDSEALNDLVDFPQLRQSLKDQFNAKFAQKMSQEADMEDNPFAYLGAAFAGMMIDKVLDAYITPAGIRQMMVGEEPKQDGARKASTRSSSGDERSPFDSAVIGYATSSKFVVSVPSDEKREIHFVLRRSGIADWKLAEILLPTE